MESTRFDSLVKMVGIRASRRASLGLLSALGLGGLLSSAADAKKRRKKCRKCGVCRRCKKGKCRPQPNGADCGACASCQGGQCLSDCAVGETCQNDACVPVQCAAGQKLCEGECILDTQCCINDDCSGNEVCCTNVHECKDVRNDDDFCGQCANGQCPGGAICANGDCGLTCTTVGASCFAPDGVCGDRVDPAHAGENVCASLSPFNCTNVTECTDDASCAPATEGFRQVCVNGLCMGKSVCANPVA